MSLTKIPLRIRRFQGAAVIRQNAAYRRGGEAKLGDRDVFPQSSGRRGE